MYFLLWQSTLFNAIAKKSIAFTANYPFATIDPNIAPVAVPDEYLLSVATLADSIQAVPATMEWIDVAGLAKGAHRGEGLGNRFLATLRECDAICHLVRVFADVDIIHVDGAVDPVEDAEVINLELVLADLAHTERRLAKTTCQGLERETLERVQAGLKEGVPARAAGLTESQAFSIKSMGLLTLKPVLYALNVDDVDLLLDRDQAMARGKEMLSCIQYCDPSTAMFTLVSAKIEAELSAKDSKEQAAYLQDLGVELLVEKGQEVDRLLCHTVLPGKIRELLDLGLIYTGPGVPLERSRTTKAYLVRNGSWTVDDLAGRLHGDIQNGFLRAEVTPASRLLEHDNYLSAKEAGCIRTEGRDCILNSGDVVLIKWK